MIGQRETANFTKKLEEVVKRVKVAGGYALDIGEVGALCTFSPTDMSDVRECTINNRGVDITDWDLQAQILAFPLNKIKPP